MLGHDARCDAEVDVGARLRILEGTPGFGAAVLESARTWRYAPAQVAGCPVRSVVSEAVLLGLFGR